MIGMDDGGDEEDDEEMAKAVSRKFDNSHSSNRISIP